MIRRRTADEAHHLMVGLYSFDDVGQGLDLALLEEGRLAVSPWRDKTVAGR